MPKKKKRPPNKFSCRNASAHEKDMLKKADDTLTGLPRSRPKEGIGLVFEVETKKKYIKPKRRTLGEGRDDDQPKIEKTERPR